MPKITLARNKTQDYDLEALEREGYRILALDSQILSSIGMCELRTKLRFMDKLELIEDTKADYLDRGDLMHTGLKIYYTLKKRPDKFDFDTRVSTSVALMRQKGATLDLDNLEAEEYIDVFIKYCNFHKQESWIPVRIEEPFSIIMHVDARLKLVIVYEGVIDLIIEGTGEEEFKIVDHKGTKRRYTPMELTNQFMGYCWALGYNTLMAQQIGFQKVPVFLRHTFSYPQESLDEWKNVAVKRICNWVEFSMDRNEFLPNFNGLVCNSFNRLCPYYKHYCKATPDSREWNVQTRYAVGKEWSPWTRDSELDKILAELMK